MKKDGTNQKGERGGFLLGMVVGLLLGLAISLGVALYVAKVPIPFIDKVPQRSAAEDEQDAQAHKNWNPNANLPGGTKPRAPAASGVVSTPAPVASTPAPATPTVAPAAASKPTTGPAPATTPATATAKASEPATAGGFVFFVQAGAFTQANDAEQQRAKLAMQGFNAKVYERASGDKTVFRVRIGPFDTREPADALIAQVQAAGMEAAVVRAQR